MTDTATKTRTLTATGRTVPAEPAYTLSGYKSMPTHDGVAATVTVRVGKTVVGTIEDGGTGGGTYFHGHSADAVREWDAFERAYSVLNPALLREADGTLRVIEQAEGTAVAFDFDAFVYVPDAADALLFEAELSKKLVSAVRRGRTVCRRPQPDLQAWADDGYAFSTVNAALDRARTQLTADGYEVFTLDRGWVPAPDA